MLAILFSCLTFAPAAVAVCLAMKDQNVVY